MNNLIKIYPARKIITMNQTRPSAEAVAVKDGRILGTGSVEELKTYGSCDVNPIFENMVLTPGMIEGHSHIGEGTHWKFPYIGYYDRIGPDGQKWAGIKDFKGVLDRLQALESQMGDPDEALVVWGFDPIFFPEDWLNKTHLDKISTTRPIFVFHISDHLATVNTSLMTKMKITKDTPVVGLPKGADGELVGELQEPYALRLAGDIYNRVADGADDDANWMTYGIQAKNAGCTTISEMAYGSPADQSAVDRLIKMIGDPDFPVRICQPYLPLAHDVENHRLAAEWVVAQQKQNTDKLHMGHVKYFLDGSIQGFTARLRTPGYYKRDINGIWLSPPENMFDTLLAYHRKGLSMHCHCNGDEAVDVFLDAVERVQAKAPRFNVRHTIHHSQLTSPSQYQRMVSMVMIN